MTSKAMTWICHYFCNFPIKTFYIECISKKRGIIMKEYKLKNYLSFLSSIQKCLNFKSNLHINRVLYMVDLLFCIDNAQRIVSYNRILLTLDIHSKLHVRSSIMADTFLRLIPIPNFQDCVHVVALQVNCSKC